MVGRVRLAIWLVSMGWLSCGLSHLFCSAWPRGHSVSLGAATHCCACHPKANAVSDVSMLSDHRSSIGMHATRRGAAVWRRVSTLVPWHHPSVSPFNCVGLFAHHSDPLRTSFFYSFVLKLTSSRPSLHVATRIDCEWSSSSGRGVACVAWPRERASVCLSDASSTPSEQCKPCACMPWAHAHNAAQLPNRVLQARVLERDDLDCPCVALCCKATLPCAPLLASDAVGAVPAQGCARCAVSPTG